MVNTILKEADLFCPNSVRINFTIYHLLAEWVNKVAAKSVVRAMID
ncbi:ABC transporter ATP-binding protein [Lactiplantibacillus plantarum]|nr:ABC transporter ATP-binding protein [Lactiplantibacillus plantarum]